MYTQSSVVNKPSKTSDLRYYFNTAIIGALVFATVYAYTSYNKIPGVLNKSFADTSTILIACSMLLTSLCYFFNFLDQKIMYRKYLGLIGFAFGIVHFGLSFSAFTNLLSPEVWEKGTMWPALTGLIAFGIFTLMAFISNRMSMNALGVMLWRNILRTGYIAMILVAAHVILLKSGRWMTWYNGGMKTLPSTSLMITVFVGIVVLLRVLMWAKIMMTKKTK